ncbi:hypothetical protein F5Y19DRAFT_472283 [Xylariaceae sp. FL1651]|nr:hypothetical protein F5Y19DRAFT_472283 [Xylariaceae sp. FL1651]
MPSPVFVRAFVELFSLPSTHESRKACLKQANIEAMKAIRAHKIWDQCRRNAPHNFSTPAEPEGLAEKVKQHSINTASLLFSVLAVRILAPCLYEEVTAVEQVTELQAVRDLVMDFEEIAQNMS